MRDTQTVGARLRTQLAILRPVVIAHRGFSTVAPENTLRAVQRAIESGTDMVEIDVRVT